MPMSLAAPAVRGTDVLNATWQLLDRAPHGRGTGFEGWPRRRADHA